MNCSFQKLLPNNIAFRNKKIGKQIKEKIKAGSIGERACYTVFAYIYMTMSIYANFDSICTYSNIDLYKNQAYLNLRIINIKCHEISPFVHKNRALVVMDIRVNTS